MTEAEWLAAADPRPMLDDVRPVASSRKLRLFAVACCRSIWDLLPNEAARTLVAVAERFADGRATEAELAAAQGPFSFPAWEPNPDDTLAVAKATDAVLGLALGPDGRFATLAGQVVPNWPQQAYEWAARAAHAAMQAVPPPEWADQRAELAARLRDIIGPLPYRPVTADPNWLTSTVTALAKQMYESRDFSPVPILADALQDAGCDHPDILAHCQSDGPHVRGCWVVDLILRLV